MSGWNAILEKAQKIRELRDRAGTPEEAAVAAEKLQQLLIKHQIEEYELNGHQPDKKRPVITIDVDLDMRGKPGRRISTGWRKQVMFGAAETHGCKAVSWRGTYKMTLVGYQTNIEAAQDLFEYLQFTIVKLAEDAWQDYRKTHGLSNARGPAAIWIRSFAEGAIDEIRNRLRQSRTNAEAEAVQTSQALVVMEQEVADKYAELFPKLGKFSTNNRYHRAAYGNGCQAGKHVVLGREINDNSRKAIR